MIHALVRRPPRGPNKYMLYHYRSLKLLGSSNTSLSPAPPPPPGVINGGIYICSPPSYLQFVPVTSEVYYHVNVFSYFFVFHGIFSIFIFISYCFHLLLSCWLIVRCSYETDTWDPKPKFLIITLCNWYFHWSVEGLCQSVSPLHLKQQENVYDQLIYVCVNTYKGTAQISFVRLPPHKFSHGFDFL